MNVPDPGNNTGSGSGALRLSEYVCHQRYENKKNRVLLKDPDLTFGEDKRWKGSDATRVKSSQSDGGVSSAP